MDVSTLLDIKAEMKRFEGRLNDAIKRLKDEGGLLIYMVWVKDY